MAILKNLELNHLKKKLILNLKIYLSLWKKNNFR